MGSIPIEAANLEPAAPPASQPPGPFRRPDRLLCYRRTLRPFSGATRRVPAIRASEVAELGGPSASVETKNLVHIIRIAVSNNMRIVCISDTHGLHDRMSAPIPDGDILIHAGDGTNIGRVNEVAAFGVWFRSLPHKHKIFVAGNHDWLFEKNRMMAQTLLNQGLIGNERKPEVIYLQDSATTVEGLKIYGSPWQPRFLDWAFNLDRGKPIKEKWDLIPEGLDILITHGPPTGILDRIKPQRDSEHIGCEELMKAVERTKPKIHVFGHIHGGYGKAVYVNTTFINAAICTEAYNPTNQPWVIEV